MARGINRLTGADLRRTKPGLFCDGEGLWLQVSAAADEQRRNRSWIFRYTLSGRTREMGLGSLNTLSLVEARERARKCRQMLLDGTDPIEQRNAARAAKAAATAKAVSFEECAHRYITAHRAEWSNEQHAKEWPASLAKHIMPTLGKLPVGTIDTALVTQALQKVWETAPETANRLRGRIEAILDWAGVSGFRPADTSNPARWAGHLEHVFAAPKHTEHHAAMAYVEVPSFIQQLREHGGAPAAAFEFLILTGARAGMVRGATWNEINLDEAVWVVPARRMKSRQEFRVPLAPRAVEIVRTMAATRRNDFVFPGRDGGLGESAFEHLIKRLGFGGQITTHGFRSSFRTWAGEATAFAHEVCEQALAHAIPNAVERAYRRGDLFEKRRRLMEAWATHCDRPAAAADVVPLRRAGGE